MAGSKRPGSIIHALLLLVCLSVPRTGTAAPIWLLADDAEQEITELSLDEAKALFLGRGALPKTASGRLLAIDREDDELRARFFWAVAQMPDWRVVSYFAERTFSGRARPPLRLQEQEALQALRDKPRAVTYIEAESPPPGYRVLLRID